MTASRASKFMGRSPTLGAKFRCPEQTSSRLRFEGRRPTLVIHLVNRVQQE
jgi:hypothetical protein